MNHCLVPIIGLADRRCCSINILLIVLQRENCFSETIPSTKAYDRILIWICTMQRLLLFVSVSLRFLDSRLASRSSESLFGDLLRSHRSAVHYPCSNQIECAWPSGWDVGARRNVFTCQSSNEYSLSRIKTVHSLLF